MMFVVWYCVIGFLVFCFANLFGMMWSHNFSHVPFEPKIGLDSIIALGITLLVFILLIRDERLAEAKKAAEEAAGQNFYENYMKEINDNKAKEQAAVKKASRKRAEGIERARAKRAREIEELEQQLAHYKNIPGDPEDDNE